jgi:hypothetical protein
MSGVKKAVSGRLYLPTEARKVLGLEEDKVQSWKTLEANVPEKD